MAAPALAPASAGDYSRSTSSGGYYGGGGGNNVLSDKVSRALAVRTDTPAMLAALDALACLPADDNDDDDGGGVGGIAVIDARSVRAAIERDALRRAVEFQSELRRLADDASALRERIDGVARVAALVGERVGAGIILDASSSSSSSFPGRDDGDGSANGYDDDADDADASGGVGGRRPPTTTTATTAADAWEGERDLAYRLASAQRSYVEAVARQAAVNAFLDKFDLGEDEARLLDRYDFVGFISPATMDGGGGYQDGEEDGTMKGGADPWNHPHAALNVVPDPSRRTMDDSLAFLDALERLTVIRRELTRTFGSGADPADADTSFGYDVDGDDADAVGAALDDGLRGGGRGWGCDVSTSRRG